jgi:hypothetical protein
VLSTHFFIAGLRLRNNKATCGSILEVSSDAFAAGEEKLVICAAEKSKYCFICTVAHGPCGDLRFTIWSRW